MLGFHPFEYLSRVRSNWEIFEVLEFFPAPHYPEKKINLAVVNAVGSDAFCQSDTLHQFQHQRA